MSILNGMYAAGAFFVHGEGMIYLSMVCMQGHAPDPTLGNQYQIHRVLLLSGFSQENNHRVMEYSLDSQKYGVQPYLIPLFTL